MACKWRNSRQRRMEAENIKNEMGESKDFVSNDLNLYCLQNYDYDDHDCTIKNNIARLNLFCQEVHDNKNFAVTYVSIKKTNDGIKKISLHAMKRRMLI